MPKKYVFMLSLYASQTSGLKVTNYHGVKSVWATSPEEAEGIGYQFLREDPNWSHISGQRWVVADFVFTEESAEYLKNHPPEVK